MAVGYANGLPLALKVMGSFLRSRSIEAWESALRKLKHYPNMDIFDVLKLSYDGLDDAKRNIFLDIAFFFKGRDKDDVIRYLDSCGFFAAIGIDNLMRKALITISKYNEIEMHDLIEQMGWEIVRQESINYPGKRSRLRNHEDIYNVLKNNKGTDLVEGIMLDLSQTRDLYLHAESFKKMHKLRFLRLANVVDLAELESLPDELRYLEWRGYPLKSLPSTFCAEKLVELHMPQSQVCKLWDGVQDLANLKEINLEGCGQLVELPDFTKASNLQKVDLSECISLGCVHPSILSVHTLKELLLNHCKKLKILKGGIHLKSLKHLKVLGCSSLEEFSVSSEEIRELNLTQTNIYMLYSSIGRLSKLEELDLANLTLESLPNEFCFLTSLQKLRLSGCKHLTELPHNIRSLSQLMSLGLRNCCGLRSLPKLPPSIIYLDATNCVSLQTVLGVSLHTVFDMKALSHLKRMIFSFKNCKRLDENSLHVIMEDAHDTLVRSALCDLLLCGTGFDEEYGFGYLNSKVCCPGSEVPRWFKYQTRQTSITVELDHSDRIFGFFLCCVISQAPSKEWNHNIIPQYYLRDGEKDTSKKKLKMIKVCRGLNSNHVYMWYDCYKLILDGITKCRGNDHCTTCNQKISVEFITKSHKRKEEEEEGEEEEAGEGEEEDGEDEFKDEYEDDDNEEEDEEEVKFADCLVKGCGICPIYISDIQNFIQKVDMELEFDDDEFKEYSKLVLNKFECLISEDVGESEDALIKARSLMLDPMSIATSWKHDQTLGENK